jgi:hypothetical protein
MPAAAETELPKMAGNLPPRQGGADIVGCPTLAIMRHGPGAFGEAARGQRNVRRDADIGLRDVIGNPVIGGVGPLSHNDHADIGTVDRANRPGAVRHHEDDQFEAAGYAIDLIPNRAGIRVDINRGHVTAGRASPGSGFLDRLDRAARLPRHLGDLAVLRLDDGSGRSLAFVRIELSDCDLPV